MNIPIEYNLESHLARKFSRLLEEEIHDIAAENLALKNENIELKKQNAKLQTTVKQLKQSLHSIKTVSSKATNIVHHGIVERIFRKPWEEKQ